MPLLQVIKKCRQACPPNILMHFLQGSIPESLVKENSKVFLFFFIEEYHFRKKVFVIDIFKPLYFLK
jgi:hypothetical protein